MESESFFFFPDPNNSSVLVGSASPGPRLSTDPQLFHSSLNLAVLWWSSRYAGLIDFRGPQGRSTMQFWGGNPRSYQRDLQDCWYYWFHKYYNPLLPKQCHVGLFFRNSVKQESTVVTNEISPLFQSYFEVSSVSAGFSSIWCIMSFKLLFGLTKLLIQFWFMIPHIVLFSEIKHEPFCLCLGSPSACNI